ncbi:parvulin-like peptidyl-prolyl isomerase [Paenibacillus cellulosilyticus]|uniref:Parvulin-like peptidyl-prolyl isomerase n=1 Tax=Paenibacillus cellulosilyticus TaxID=375489 RepID=A0A2V2YPA8_9BACL|nr:peptidylprolyl isomerase [Paenibacillus cellulosilyticus]PWV97905.1 parvulin-like peptidyl-prolyl isomerase [Paenibacillus cellulosilyticus]QKS46926.1 peptidylprolyl isomerase [Paenibacillus cellulosilyticus]
MYKLKHVIVSFCAGALFFSGVSYAADPSKIEVIVKPLKLFFDGVEKKVPDSQPSIVYNGTTYVPLRFAADAFGQGVRYDGAKSSIYFTTPKQQSGTDLVATVNGIGIQQQQLFEALIKGGNGDTVLGGLITYELVKQEADARGILITTDDIQRELNNIINNMGSRENFELALQQYHMTEDDLYPDLLEQAQLRKLLLAQINITDSAIRSYYNQYKDSFNTPEQVHASHILVATKDEADAIYTQLINGTDFAALAKEKSIDTGSGANGGDLGYFARGVMVSEFEDAAFSLKVGEISLPVQSQYGYHLILVTDHKAAVTKTLEDVKDQIKETLTSQKIYELSPSYIDELRAKADIKNLLGTNSTSSK